MLDINYSTDIVLTSSPSDTEFPYKYAYQSKSLCGRDEQADSGVKGPLRYRIFINVLHCEPFSVGYLAYNFEEFAITPLLATLV